MINADQPTIFGGEIIAAVSSMDNGSMSYKSNPQTKKQVEENRRRWFKKIGIDTNDVRLVRVTYDTTTFCRYQTVSRHEKATSNLESVSDALVTRDQHLALFLPIADCAGLIVYDSTTKSIMVSHVGRQAAEQQGAKKSITYFLRQTNATLQDIRIWISPAVGRVSYPIHALHNQGLHEAIQAQLYSLGVAQRQIEASPIDTATSSNYFSHSQFLQGDRTVDGRFAVIAMMNRSNYGRTVL